jgi:6,7-dimethyl-8-ribityllumazine synthase
MAAKNKGEPDASRAHRFVALSDSSLPQGTERAVIGSLDGKGLRVAIACSRFNFDIGTRLFEGARATALRRGVLESDLSVVFVPGAFELPMAAKALATSGETDAVVCLGAIIRGETSHYDLIATQAAAGCEKVQLETGVPVAFGILTTENTRQALARSGGAQGNLGAQAMDSAIEMARLLEALKHVGPRLKDAGPSSLERAR